MTTAEQLRAEGRAQGRAEGTAGVLIKQLTLKFGPLSEPVVSAIENASPEQLDRWVARVLTADSLHQVLSA
ncbi:DUF4351 domain-containing protein [Nocardia sp. NPDC048505]|uniref:DUF4351 domain-containing protein n=1 Tax=unclassified Nocardia TaxID=2637762 RepID=UPI0033EA61EF